MNRTTRISITAASFALIAVAAKFQDASAIWECYACTTSCTYGVTGCFLDCNGHDFNRCFEDTIEFCDPGEIILECTEPNPG